MVETCYLIFVAGCFTTKEIVELLLYQFKERRSDQCNI